MNIWQLSNFMITFWQLLVHKPHSDVIVFLLCSHMFSQSSHNVIDKLKHVIVSSDNVMSSQCVPCWYLQGQYRNGFKSAIVYVSMVNSFSVVQSVLCMLHSNWFNHSQLNLWNWYRHSNHSSVELQHEFTCIIGSIGIHTGAFWQSMNIFRWPGVSMINFASIPSLMKVTLLTFNFSSHTD